MTRISILVLVLASRVAVADVTDAERLYTEGQTAYDAGRYDDAIAAWDKSYALSNLPGLVFNLAQAHRLANHCTKAVEAYHRFLQLDPKSEERPAAEQFLRELEPCADAAKPLPPPPFTPPHDQVMRVVDRGQGKRVTGLVTLGAGVALVATGLYFGNQATSLADDVNTACAMGCEFSAIESKDAAGRRDAKLQYVFYGLGAAGIVTGTVLYALGSRARKTSTALGTLTITPHGATVRVRW